MDGDAGDVTLQLEAELGERSDVLDGGDFVQTDDGRGRLELVCSSLDEAGVDLALVGSAELETVGLGDHLHGRVFEFGVGTFLGEILIESDEIIEGPFHR